MEHFRQRFYWNRSLFLFTFVLLIFGLLSHFSNVALAQTEVPLEGQSAIIEKSLRQSIPTKPVPQDPIKSIAPVLNKGRFHASDFAELIAPSVNKKGMVVAKLDTVRMVSGEVAIVDFVGNNLILFTVSKPVEGKVLDKDGNVINNRISNAVSLKAKGGQAIMTARNASNIIKNVINTEGILEANTVTKKHGCIFLQNETMSRSQKHFDEMPCF
tara:strand:- start:254 stop:895 length:642 start_codon:yes stop_codon:yes gene_type:complete